MKIVHVIPSLQKSGGAETLCVDLVIAFKKMGHEAIIVTLYQGVDFYKKKLDDSNISYYCLNKHTGLDIPNSIKLRQLLKKINPDIVHSHLSTEISFFVGGVYRKKKIKYFHTIHYSISERTMPDFINFHLMRHYIKRSLIQYIAISHEVRVCFLKYMKIKNEIPIIYNGIQTKDFLNRVVLDKRKKDFICVANFTKTKNHLTLVEAFNQVLQHNKDVCLTLVGDGALRNEIENKIQQLKLENNVFLLGERKDIAKLLSEHKFFILPSLQEGNPISILEAMASGLVILVTKYGGPKDIIINSTNGYLLDPFSKEQIADTMVNCLKNDKLNNKIQINNLSKVMTYDISKVAEQHLVLYKK